MYFESHWSFLIRSFKGTSELGVWLEGIIEISITTETPCGTQSRQAGHSTPGFPHDPKCCENVLEVIWGNSSTGIWFKSPIHCKQPATTSLLFSWDRGWIRRALSTCAGLCCCESRILATTCFFSCPWERIGHYLAFFWQWFQVLLNPFIIFDGMRSSNFLRWHKPRTVFGHVPRTPLFHEGRPSSPTGENEGKIRMISALALWGQLLPGVPVSQANKFPHFLTPLWNEVWCLANENPCKCIPCGQDGVPT